MARPAQLDKSDEYAAIRRDSYAHGEGNDCAVVALAVACGVAYAVAREALAAAGRKTGKGTYFAQTEVALAALGFRAEQVSTARFVQERYPRAFAAKQVKITTHHADRFPGVFQKGETFLMRTQGHILCVKDGVNHDWTRGKAKQVILMYRVVKA